MASSSGVCLFDTDRKTYLSFFPSGKLQSTELEPFPQGIKPTPVEAISLLQEGAHTHIWSPSQEGYSDESFLTLRKRLMSLPYDSTYIQRGVESGTPFLKQIFLYTTEDTLKRAEKVLWR